MLISISFWLVNQWLLGQLWFQFLLDYFDTLWHFCKQIFVYHLIWLLVSKFCLGKSYTQDTQEDTVPTSEEGVCDFSEMFLSLCCQECSCWTVVYPGSSLWDQRVRTQFCLWDIILKHLAFGSPVVSKNKTVVSTPNRHLHHKTKLVIPLNHIPPQSGI